MSYIETQALADIFRTGLGDVNTPDPDAGVTPLQAAQNYWSGRASGLNVSFPDCVSTVGNTLSSSSPADVQAACQQAQGSAPAFNAATACPPGQEMVVQNGVNAGCAPVCPQGQTRNASTGNCESPTDTKALFGFFGEIAKAGATVGSTFITADATKSALRAANKPAAPMAPLSLPAIPLPASSDSSSTMLLVGGGVLLLGGLGLVALLASRGGRRKHHHATAMPVPGGPVQAASDDDDDDED